MRSTWLAFPFARKTEQKAADKERAEKLAESKPKKSSRQLSKEEQKAKLAEKKAKLAETSREIKAAPPKPPSGASGGETTGGGSSLRLDLAKQIGSAGGPTGSGPSTQAETAEEAALRAEMEELERAEAAGANVGLLVVALDLPLGAVLQHPDLGGVRDLVCHG